MLIGAPLRDLTMQSTETMRIGGLPGFEIRAQAEGLHGTPLRLVQWLRFGGGSYLRVIGVGRKDDWDALFTRFRAVRDGIDLTLRLTSRRAVCGLSLADDGGAFGAALTTATSAGRSTRSPSM